MPNALANESSPYLLQHADNPVDWHAWNSQALQKAQQEDKPIFLSIGYAACHWCHVMAHESFEDERVAAILNQHFISIKVDREERPDLDQIYMTAVQALTGNGGWPMSVFLTPDGSPFFGGTYYPPQPRYGMPSFTQVLIAVRDAWQNRRTELLQSGRQLVNAVRNQNELSLPHQSAELTSATLTSAFQALQTSFDQRYGGWGKAPKFPQPMILEFLLRYDRRNSNAQAIQMVTRTLEAMARGGMYDQLGGGFHRYSVDERWLVPHFEKMLYDNAQLARLYLHAWQHTRNPFFRTITEEILDYVLREMSAPSGGFYSTQDADSEGEEGKFFVWTPDEIQTAIGDEAQAFMAAYAVTQGGNFEGKNILEFIGDDQQRAALSKARRKLFDIREQRVHPHRDEKVLASWNGLMLAAFAEASRALGREDYRQAALRNATFLWENMRQQDGKLLHSYLDGRARFNAYLEDYSYLIEGFLELYQTVFDPRWYQAAKQLAETMIEHFRADAGGFYDTSDDHEALITRPRDLQDNATPSGNAMAVTALLKLAGLSGETRFIDLAQQALAQMQPLMAQHPLGFGQWLTALSFALSSPYEIAIIGEPNASDTDALLKEARRGYQPYQVIAMGKTESLQLVPLLHDRRMLDDHATAYVCTDFVCRQPVISPEELRKQLGRD